eukprot:gene9997-7881_t
MNSSTHSLARNIPPGQSLRPVCRSAVRHLASVACHFPPIPPVPNRESHPHLGSASVFTDLGLKDLIFSGMRLQPLGASASHRPRPGARSLHSSRAAATCCRRVATSATSSRDGMSRRELLATTSMLPFLGAAGAAVAAEPTSIYDFSAFQYDKEVSLSKYKDQVLVVVNIASE